MKSRFLSVATLSATHNMPRLLQKRTHGWPAVGVICFHRILYWFLPNNATTHNFKCLNSIVFFFKNLLFLLLESESRNLGPTVIFLKLNWTLLLLFFGLLFSFVSLFLICKGLDFTFMDWANRQSMRYGCSYRSNYRDYRRFGNEGFNASFIPYISYIPSRIASRVSVKKLNVLSLIVMPIN